MAKNCGCKPCAKPLPKATKVCKPFSFCSGNKTIVWDGGCLYEQDRTYQIPDGTYTSITFTGGCITAVGLAPIPQYTPQQCCDGEGNTGGQQSGSDLTVGKAQGNLAVIQNNTLTVKPMWDNNGIITVDGYGTADKPWKPKVKISKQQGNNIQELSDGLFANTYFKTTTSVEVKGSGTAKDPYTFTVKGAEPKLDEINKDEFAKEGITIREDGRVAVEEKLMLVTNLSFNNESFTINDTPSGTTVNIDLQKLVQALDPHIQRLGYTKQQTG